MKELRESLNKIRVAKKPVRVDAVIEPDFWVDLKYVVTVKADEITRSPTHTCGRKKLKDGTEVGYALRFPRLVGPEAIRSDKSPEDATTTKEIEELYSQQKKVGLKE
jgi:DNA ligase-1